MIDVQLQVNGAMPARRARPTRCWCEFLREQLRLHGHARGLRYEPVRRAPCILDGQCRQVSAPCWPRRRAAAAVVTVEGLNATCGGKLHPVQAARSSATWSAMRASARRA